MWCQRVILVCSLFFINTTATKLPPSFKKCNTSRTDVEDCVSRAIEDAVGQLTKPFKEVGLTILDPLEIPSMSIAPGSGPTNFQQNYKNMKISGLSKAKISNVKLDFGAYIVKFDATFAELLMEFEYDFNGKILVLPFYGKGNGVMKIVNPVFKFEYNLEIYTNKEVPYYKVKNLKLAVEPKQIIFKLDNLFNGDESLGKNINQVFNDNWKEVYEDVKPSYEEVFGQIFSSMFNSLLAKVPIPELADV